ncbi:MobF family relaxase [Tautonia rosea]|uniref:MobF family relaxase n=1 Tax=Tautonia rosea TaxID=2728037 RepID=UPI00147455EA|nr:MobF family relaxase [Tautonia rosea]
MLSIAPVTPGHASYYLEIASADYYVRGGEPEGTWIGGGAPALGLRGRVSGEALENLLDGHSPRSRHVKLVQNAGKSGVNYRDASGEIRVRHRQMGWDLTFSPPKDVDALWAAAPSDVRAEIQRCHFDAVRRAMNYLESEAAVCRRGKGGTEREAVTLACAVFEHGTSRANDPKLHSHVVVANVGVRADGTTGTVESLPFYQHQRTAGALYRAELSHLLGQELGIRSQRATETAEVLGEPVTIPKSWFELPGVPRELCDHWSKRRQDVLAYMARYGGSGAADAEEAVINSRGRKEIRPRGELLAEWQEVARAHGFTPQAARALTGHPVEHGRDPEAIMTGAIDEALRAVTASESVFTRRDLVQHVAEAVQGRGQGADAVLEAVDRALEHHPEVVRLTEREPGTGTGPDAESESAYTTVTMLELEAKLLEDAGIIRDRCEVRASDASLEATLAGRPTLTAEQKIALLKTTREPSDLQLVSGDPGTGKTFFLGALREAFERDGIQVSGACVAGKAARGLEEESGIRSRTVYGLLRDLEGGDREKADAALPRRSVLVVDEAGMLGTRDAARLLEAARERECRVVLVGDAKQLQAVDAGGPLRGLLDRFGGAELTGIIRQREEITGAVSPWKVEAIRQIGRGEGSKALQAYDEKGWVHVAEDRISAMRELVARWGEHAGEPERALIFAATRADVARLNDLCREERMARGLIHRSRTVTLDPGTTLHQGDRVLFSANSKRIGVSNGDLGTIERIRGRSLAVRLDRGETVVVHADTYPSLLPGYAMTTHRAQGVTVDRAFVLAGGPMQDRELSYVQASRARYEVRFFASKLDAGENLDRLGRRVERSRPKTLASDVGTAGEHRTRGRREAAVGPELTLVV